MVRPFVTEERLITEREVLDVNRSGYHTAGDIEPLADVPFHLGTKDGGGFNPSDRISNCTIIITDQHFIAVFAHLLAEPLFIVLTISTRQDDVNPHLPRQNLSHSRRVGIIAKDNSLFPRPVLAVNRRP